MRLPVLTKSITVLFETQMILHSLSHHSRSLIYLQAADEQRWLRGRGYDNRVVRVENQLDMAEVIGISLTYRLNRTGYIIPL